MSPPLDGDVLLMEAEFSTLPPLASLLEQVPEAERSFWAAELKKTAQRAALRLARSLWLREQLSLFSGRPLDELRLAFGRYRKPSLPGRSLHFNVSHSASYSVLALSRWPVGIDVEQCELSRHDFRRVAEFWFHPHEQAYLDALPEGRARSVFFCLWTRKEALAKAQGQAVSRTLSRDNLLWPPGLKWYARRHYWLFDLDRAGRRICVCSRARPRLLWLNG